MLFNNLGIYFYVRASTTPGKKGIFYIRVTANKKKLCTSSIKNIRLNPEEFNHKTQTPTVDSEYGLACTMFMNTAREKLNVMHIEYEKKKRVLSKKSILDALPGILSTAQGLEPLEAKTFSIAYEEYLEDQKKQVGKLISYNTYRVRKYYKKMFETVLNSIGLLNQPLMNFTPEHIREIQFRMLDTHSKAHVARSIPVFSHIFEIAIRQEILFKNPCKEVPRIKQDSDDDPIWLDPEELAAITQLDLDVPNGMIRDAFVFCSWTGLSIGDYELMNPKNSAKIMKTSNSPKKMDPATIIRTKDGMMLCGKRRKTGTMYRVPLMPEAERILGKYGGIENLPYSFFRAGNTINLLLKLAGIDKPGRFHMARKTFANYLINEKMISPQYVLPIMGWRKIEEANNYISVKNSALHRSVFQ